MYRAGQLVGQRAIHHAVPIYEPAGIEAFRDDNDLEMRLRSHRHVVLRTLVVDGQVQGTESCGQFGFDGLTNVHGLSLSH